MLLYLQRQEKRISVPLQQDAPLGVRTPFSLSEIIRAIELEIAHMKTQGGQKYRLTEGVLLYSYGDGTIYQFQLAVEVSLMDGTRAELVLPGELETEKEQVEILSQERLQKMEYAFREIGKVHR